PSTLAISAGTGFDGINNAESACGCLPPDGAVAAGPNHLVAAVNTAFKVWNKSGTLLAGPTSLSTLFSSNSGCLATVSDPFAEYDSAAGRFVLGALTYVSSGTSAICVAVSRTGDPTGNWFVYAFTVTPANDLLDFPHIAIGSDAIFLSGNQYPHNNTFTAARVYAYNKAQMYAGQAASSVFYEIGNNSANNLADTLTPARGMQAAGTEYFIAADNCSACSNISVWKWTNPFGASSFTLQGGVS